MNGWTFAWLLWLAMFACIEAPALLNKTKGDSFSEHIWSWFAIRDKPRQWRARRAVLLAAVTWLAVHFLTGGHY